MLSNPWHILARADSKELFSTHQWDMEIFLVAIIKSKRDKLP